MGSDVEYLVWAKFRAGHFLCIFTLISHNLRKFLLPVRQLRPRAVKQLVQHHIASLLASIYLIREVEPLAGVCVCVFVYLYMYLYL